MANAASGYVVPIGHGVGSGIWGPEFDSADWKTSESNVGIFDTYDQYGNRDPRGPNAAPQDAWNELRLGRGTVAAPEVLNQAARDSQQRYSGDPNNLDAQGNPVGGWRSRWDAWNATDVTGPDGRTLFSPVHQTGLRVSQNYGARGDDGNPYEASEGDIFNAFKGVRNNLNQDPWLTPTMALAGMRGLNENSPYARPDPRDYVSTMARAQGGPGQADFYGQRGIGQTEGTARSTDFDRYGQRGIDQTDELAGANLRQLSRGIDREAQESLANRLPEVQQMMEAAGLGRSGAGQMQMQQAQGDILNQANRDKNRTMADFTDREASRRSGAINLATQQGFGGERDRFNAITQAQNLASQIGAQGYENYAGRQGQAAMQGIGDQFSMNQANRQNEQALWSKQIDNRYSKNQYDQDALLRSLGMSGDQLDRRLAMQDQGQSGALRDWLGLQDHRTGTQERALTQALGLADAQRRIQQDRVNQMLQAGMQPWETQLRIATGTTQNSSPNNQQRSFWDSNAGGAVMGAGVDWLMSGGPRQTFNDFSNWTSSRDAQ